ncbi:hypothetical protein D9615_005364 [Tricholomella constricta]|uniref:Hyaluronan/mRNA-binding protein domain-containing protein n=1 Tax=Tricholomella constricta TaxID=117010 RepID=A0A8H5H6B0_9AGAR|nr:hypothetical protein D9615_005364 [Tricholomella constricta]
MSVATKNPFALLDAEGASRPSSPAPIPAAQAPPAPPVPARGNLKPRGGPAARGGKYYARGGANKPAPKDSNPNQNGVEEPVPVEGQRRFENRGRGRGARGVPRGGRRPFDKHSQTGKTDSDKKIQQSWGGADGNTELKNEQDATVDAAAESNEWAADSAPAADWGTPAADADAAPAAEGDKAESRPRREREPEEEDNTLTLDQYLAQQKEKETVIPKLEGTRRANEGADANIWKDVVPLEKVEEDAYFVGKTKNAPKARTKKEEKVFLEIEARFERPDRGGRGRGGRGGDRGGDRARGGRGRGGGIRSPRQATAPVVNVDDQTAFPSLS